MKYLSLVLVLMGIFATCSAQDDGSFSELKIFRNIYGKYSIDEKNATRADTNLIGIWKMDEDPDQHNYFVFERFNYNTFACTYINRGGSNRTYENFGVFFSKIGNQDFINVGYSDISGDVNGFFFLKVTDLDSRGWSMTLSLVADTTLKYLPNSNAVKEQIQKNSNNANYYKKAMHFHKILPLMYCK